jgi:hypothetical protein
MRCSHSLLNLYLRSLSTITVASYRVNRDRQSEGAALAGSTRIVWHQYQTGAMRLQSHSCLSYERESEDPVERIAYLLARI